MTVAVRRADGTCADALVESCTRWFGQVEFQVTGTCMAPILPEGTRVVLSPPGSRRPRFGEVVLARTREGLRLHRLVWAPPFGLGWRTKADRAHRWDPPISPADILGTVVACDDGRDPARGRRWRALRSWVMLFGPRVRRLLPWRCLLADADA